MSENDSFQSGHRNTDAIADNDEFGFKRRLESLSKRQYWIILTVFAVGFTVISMIWQNYWLPEKPIQWQEWSRFQAQQTISLKRPLLIWVQPDSANSGEISEETIESQWRSKLETPMLRQRFHLRSGVAMSITTQVDDSQLLWLFPIRPAPATHWLCLDGKSPQSIDLEKLTIDELLERFNRPSKEAVDGS